MGLYDEPVVVPPSIMKRITASLGTPILDLAEDLFIDDEMIKELFIRPSLQLYFTYWPKLLKEEYAINQNTNIPFPNDNVYSIVQARVALMQNANSWSSNPFLNEIMRRQVSPLSSYGRTPNGRDIYHSNNFDKRTDRADELHFPPQSGNLHCGYR
jgi:hypothetical protein